jgi:fatty-acyl-CoA synthase
MIQRSFEPSETFRLLAERATMFFGVPAVYLFLSQHPDFENTGFAQMRSWSCGGAPMPVPLLEMYAARGIVIRQGMGMTETGPTCFLIDEKNAISKIGSVGKPQLYVQTRIVDANGVDVRRGEAGELMMRGPGITPGYWNMPEATKAAFTEDGWLRSGDIAREDEDGYYYIIDRAKDMYISGGENVYPAEVENVLYACPDIAEAAVIGVPDEKWGEVGKAVVVLKAGHTPTEAVIIAFCAERLAKFKVPKSVVFVDALPRNASGKVVKPELRALYGK